MPGFACIKDTSRRALWGLFNEATAFGGGILKGRGDFEILGLMVRNRDLVRLDPGF